MRGRMPSEKKLVTFVVIVCITGALIAAFFKSAHSQSVLDDAQAALEALGVLQENQEEDALALATLEAYLTSGSPTPTAEPTGSATSTPQATAVMSPTATSTVVTVTSTITPTSEPTIAATNTVAPTATLSPTATATAQPIADVPFGVYPDCKAPGVGWETHAWWWEDGDDAPRHLHAAACMPLAGEGGPVITEPVEIVGRYIMYASPTGEMWQTRWRWESDYADQVALEPSWTCGESPTGEWDAFERIGTQMQCIAYFTWLVDPAEAQWYQIEDLRIETRAEFPELGTEERTGVTAAVDVGPREQYNRYSRPFWARARSWYPGSEYAVVEWRNMRSFIDASEGETRPVLEGQVTLPVEFRNCTDPADFAVYVNPNFHALHGGTVSDAPQPIWTRESSDGGCRGNGIPLDTTDTSIFPENGLYLLYIELDEAGPNGRHSVAMGVEVEIRN